MMKRISTYWKAIALPLMMGAAMTFALTACEPEPTYEELRESFEYDPAQVTEQITGAIYGRNMNSSLLFRENRTAALSHYGYSWDDSYGRQLVQTAIDSYTYDWRTENNVLRLSRISGQSVGMGVAMTERMVAERATHVDEEPLPDGTEILFIDLGEEASLFINHWSRISYIWGFLPEY